MQCQTYVRLFACRDDGLQKVGDVLPQLLVGMNAFVGNRGQVFHLIDVERGISCSAAAFFQVVALDGPMRVPVVLDDRQAHFARGANRTLEVLDLFIAGFPSSAIDAVVKTRDHHVAHQ